MINTYIVQESIMISYNQYLHYIAINTYIVQESIIINTYIVQEE